MQSKGRPALRIPLPNSTRAAGHHIFYNSMVTQKFNLDLYFWSEGKEDKGLSEGKAIVVAQLEATLYPVALLTKLVQTDKDCSLSYSFMLNFRVFVCYATQAEWWVARVDKSENSDAIGRWHGGAKFPARNYKGIPIRQDAPSLTTVSLIKIKKSELKPVPQKLIGRIEKEFYTYGAKPNKNQLIAMACNPLTATIGILELQVQSGVLKKLSVNDQTKAFAVDFKQLAMDALVEQLKQTCSEMRGKTADSASDAATAVQGNKSPTDDCYDDILNELTNADEATGTQDPYLAEVEAFFKNGINWANYLSSTGVDKDIINRIGNSKGPWLKSWELIAQNFDCMKWWEEVGKQQYPMIYIVACQIHPLPESNGDQERTFSAATWMDGKLNNRQSSATFQMKTLMYKNKDLLDLPRLDVKKNAKRIASKGTKMLLEQANKMVSDDEEVLSDDEDEILGKVLFQDNDQQEE